MQGTIPNDLTFARCVINGINFVALDDATIQCLLPFLSDDPEEVFGLIMRLGQLRE